MYNTLYGCIRELSIVIFLSYGYDIFYFGYTKMEYGISLCI